MTNIEKRSISFNDAKSKFSNGGLQTDSSSNESIDSIGKKFKYEVKLPGVIHTTARKNNVGDGLNDLNARKEADFAVPKPEEKKVTLAAEDELETVKFLKTLSKTERENLGFSSKQSDGKEVQSQSLSDGDTFPELPACAYKPALFPKPSKEKVREALDRMREASNSVSVEDGISPDRFNSSSILMQRYRWIRSS